MVRLAFAAVLAYALAGCALLEPLAEFAPPLDPMSPARLVEPPSADAAPSPVLYRPDAVDLGDTVRLRRAPLPRALGPESSHRVFVSASESRSALLDALAITLELDVLIHPDTIALGLLPDVALGNDFSADGVGASVLDAAARALDVARWRHEEGLVWFEDHAILVRRAGPSLWSAPGAPDALADVLGDACAARCLVRSSSVLGRIEVVAPARLERAVSRALDAALGAIVPVPVLEAVVLSFAGTPAAVVDAHLSRDAVRAGAGWAVHAEVPPPLVVAPPPSAALAARVALAGPVGVVQRLAPAPELVLEVVRRAGARPGHVALEVTVATPGGGRFRHVADLGLGSTLSLSFSDDAHDVLRPDALRAHWVVALRAVAPAPARALFTP